MFVYNSKRYIVSLVTSLNQELVEKDVANIEHTWDWESHRLKRFFDYPDECLLVTAMEQKGEMDRDLSVLLLSAVHMGLYNVFGPHPYSVFVPLKSSYRFAYVGASTHFFYETDVMETSSKLVLGNRKQGMVE